MNNLIKPLGVATALSGYVLDMGHRTQSVKCDPGTTVTYVQHIAHGYAAIIERPNGVTDLVPAHRLVSLRSGVAETSTPTPASKPSDLFSNEDENEDGDEF